jgi:hypothetical protein
MDFPIEKTLIKKSKKLVTDLYLGSVALKIDQFRLCLLSQFGHDAERPNSFNELLSSFSLASTLITSSEAFF